MSELHDCKEHGCVCPLDGKPVLYSKEFKQHACSDKDCEYAHGFPRPTTFDNWNWIA